MDRRETWRLLCCAGGLLGVVLTGIYLLGLPPWTPGSAAVLAGLWLGAHQVKRDRPVS